MSDDALKRLAAAAGIGITWKDVFGKSHEVAPPTLRAVLVALGFAAGTPAQIEESLAQAGGFSSILPPLVTAELGWPISLPAHAARYSLSLEDGRTFDGIAEARQQGCAIPAILEAGYHRLTLGDQQTVIAVAPRSCLTVPEATGAAKSWGLAIQLYGLRREGDGGLGDFASLAAFAPHAARRGAHALAISPVHAQFSADPHHFSPYAPSSRTALNVLHGALTSAHPASEMADLVDWPEAAAHRLTHFRALYAAAMKDPEQAARFGAFRDTQGERLHAHALFESLHAHFYGADFRAWNWRGWPAGYRHPDSPAVQEFAARHQEEIGFHTWLQYHADESLAAAQQACKSAGMGIGLVTDLAVGTDSGGSQCWSRPEETLIGLTIGAPPDLLQRLGQNWGLTAFSPHGLQENGFLTFREMLHAALAHAGGMRIDHSMGLNRLWVIPDGATGAEGAYLNFPEADLVRLIKLESQRNRAIILAEDLGTVPDGFSDRLRDAGICGMRVLWFERDRENRFVNPAHWTPRASAMTSTHDLATLAGWWEGNDLAWQKKLGYPPDDAAVAEREADRVALWEAMQQTDAAQGEPPEWDHPDAFVQAAIAHVGRAASELVMLPLEDALGLDEQPNLPGTIEEHPNWRRRMAQPVETLLEGDATAARLAALQQARTST